MKDIDRLMRLFDMQGTLQHRMGYDFGVMDGTALVDYIRLNVLALTDELHEALGEIHWKPWATAPPGFRDRERYVEEIADALHFLLNLCLAGRISADELMSAFEGKNAVNHQRQDAGYTGLEKCGWHECSRSLDDRLNIFVLPEGPEEFCSAACATLFQAEWKETAEAGA
jgi:dimeric dUTPase (all-alpha-NTP-PPase superfamily)